MSNNRYVCERCAQISPTCCRLGSIQGEYGGEDCFPLSEPERERIAKAVAEARRQNAPTAHKALPEAADKAADAPTGQTGWAVKENNSQNFVRAMCNLFPGERKKIRQIFPDEAGHMRLALAADGGCVFLSATGCTLPKESRPWFCRIFPFWAVKNRLQCFQAEDCVAVRESGGNFSAVLDSFCVSPEEVLEHYKRLRADWGVDDGQT